MGLDAATLKGLAVVVSSAVWAQPVWGALFPSEIEQHDIREM